MTVDTRTKYAIDTATNGNIEHAKSMVIDLVAEDWNNAEAHRAWGAILLQEGKTSDAVASFRVALNLNPQNPEGYFELADALVIQTHSFALVPLPNWAEAQELVQEGMRLAPGHPHGLNLQATFEQMRTQFSA